jgi:hypothetical protein
MTTNKILVPACMRGFFPAQCDHLGGLEQQHAQINRLANRSSSSQVPRALLLAQLGGRKLYLIDHEGNSRYDYLLSSDTPGLPG